MSMAARVLHYSAEPPDLRKPGPSGPLSARGIALRRYPRIADCALAAAVFSFVLLGGFAVFAVSLSSRGFGRPVAVRFSFSSREEVARFLRAFRRWRRFWRGTPIFGSSAWVRSGLSFPRVGSVAWFAFFPCCVRIFALSPRLWLPEFAPSAVFSVPSPRARRC